MVLLNQINILKPIRFNTQDALKKEEKRKRFREIQIGILLYVIQAYYKPIKENADCRLINMFNFDKGEDLETTLIRTLISGKYK